MRDIIELSPHVLPVANNCPEPVMTQYLREAAITFCQRSRSWRSDQVYPFTTGEQPISLVTCCDSVIYEIESVRWRGVEGGEWQDKIEAAPYDDSVGYFYDGNPQYYTQKLPGQLLAFPFTPGELRVVMYLKPDQQADTLPDYLIEMHPEIIAAGALAKILMLPKYDFANPQLAMFYQNQFDAYCDSHFRDNKRGQQRARTRTKPNYF